MTQKTAIAGALALMLCANIRLGCIVSVDGNELEERYCAGDLKRCIRTAEEISNDLGLKNSAKVERRIFLSFRPVHGDVRYLTDAILSANPEIERGNTVYYNDRYIGSVRNVEDFEAALHNSLPHFPRGELELVPKYIKRDKIESNADVVEILMNTM